MGMKATCEGWNERRLVPVQTRQFHPTNMVFGDVTVIDPFERDHVSLRR